MRDVAIVAYGETKIALRSGRSAYDLAGEVMDQIIGRTAIDKTEIDGVCVTETLSQTENSFWPQYVCEMLGLSPTWLELVALGGASPIGGVARATAAIRAGFCRTALVIAADGQLSGRPPEQGAHRFEFLYPTGLHGPVGAFGLIMQRYQHLYGLKDAALAKLAVTQRNHGLLNPNACDKLRVPLTEQDYLQSKRVSTPLRLLDSVLVCEGANGVLLTSDDNARRLGLEMKVFPTSYAEQTHYNLAEPLAEITESGFLSAGPRAFRQAGLTPNDIASFHPYDDFFMAVLLQFEHLGFCERGQACDFVLDTDLSFRGKLPLNTGGGQISAGQPRLAGGGVNLVEAVRQLFGEAGARQVANRRNAVVTGIGGIPYARNWATSAVLVLEQ
jgi:acetyl-CoA acetyltransferase